MGGSLANLRGLGREGLGPESEHVQVRKWGSAVGPPQAVPELILTTIRFVILLLFLVLVSMSTVSRAG